MILSFLLLFILSTGLLYFGVVGVDTLSVKLPKGKAAAMEKVKTGVIVKESDLKSSYALGLSSDGKSLQGLVKADFDSVNDVLSFSDKALLPAAKPAGQPTPPALVSDILKDGNGLNSFIRQKSLAMAFLASLVVAFFFCTLWFFPRIAPWPLFGALVSLLAFRLALLLTAASASGQFATYTSALFPATASRWVPFATLACVGVAFLVLDLIATATRKKRGAAP